MTRFGQYVKNRLTVFVGCALLGSSSLANAGGVTVVRSSDLAQYKAVNQAFETSLGQPVKSVNLPEIKEDQFSAILTGSSLVFAVGPDAAKAVVSAKLSSAIYAMVSNPERLGVDPSRVVPMFVSPGRQIREIKETLPKLKRIGMLYDPATSGGLVNEYATAAAAGGIELVRSEVGSHQEVASKLRALVGKVDAVWLIPDSTVVSTETIKFMVQTSLEARLPLIGFSEGMTRAGALISLQAEYPDMGRKAAVAAKRILSGGTAVLDPPEGQMSINMKTAELLELTIPASVKGRASKTFE